MDEGFRKYIIEKGNTERLSYRKMKLAKQFEDWLSGIGIRLEQTRYEDLMDFVGWMQAEEMSVYQINRMMQALSDYYDYKEVNNVAYNIRIRGQVQKAVGKQFTSEELDQIYEHYEVNLGSWGYQYHSDKLILGLIIYQGLELNSFFGIRMKDVDFKRGRIYVRAHQQRLERYIPLAAHQIQPLQEYMNERSEIIEEWLWKRKYLSEADKVITDRLFSPQCERYPRMHEQMKRLSKEVKKQAKEKLGYEVRKLSHFRQSRICIWIEQYGLRKTQYLAGLRSVMSVERYKKKDLKGLKKAVKKYHPW